VIIDCHGHVSAPAQLWAYKAGLLASRGSHGRGGVKVTDDEMRSALNAAEIGPKSHLDALTHHGTDVQLISPRPFQLMHSERPAKLVHWFAEECHTIIHRQTQMYPNKFFGVASLPQAAGDPIERALPELERCVKQLGFVGCLLNPDPYENSGVEPPALGDRYWYPLYEKLCELDVPAHIHTASSRSERASYSVHLINEGTIAILGLLKERSMHGYQLSKRLTDSLGGFWRVSYGSLYPSLKRLERQGAVEQIFDKQEVGRRKNVYRITEKGEALFRELLEESGPESSGEDNRFRVRMAFFKYLSPETRIRLLERRRAFLEERLSTIRSSLATTGGDMYTMSLMQHGRETTEQDIAWLDGLIAAERRATETMSGGSKRRSTARSLRRKERAT